MTGPFPSLADLGMNLVTVLDQLRIKHVIGLGDGAGANIMARFAMMHGRSEFLIVLWQLKLFYFKISSYVSKHWILPHSSLVLSEFSSFFTTFRPTA